MEPSLFIRTDYAALRYDFRYHASFVLVVTSHTVLTSNERNLNTYLVCYTNAPQGLVLSLSNNLLMGHVSGILILRHLRWKPGVMIGSSHVYTHLRYQYHLRYFMSDGRKTSSNKIRVLRGALQEAFFLLNISFGQRAEHPKPLRPKASPMMPMMSDA